MTGVVIYINGFRLMSSFFSHTTHPRQIIFSDEMPWPVTKYSNIIIDEFIVGCLLKSTEFEISEDIEIGEAFNYETFLS